MDKHPLQSLLEKVNLHVVPFSRKHRRGERLVSAIVDTFEELEPFVKEADALEDVEEKKKVIEGFSLVEILSIGDGRKLVYFPRVGYVDDDSCPGCGCKPGDGITQRCVHPGGCGTNRERAR